MSTSTLRDNKAFEVNPILVINPSTLKRLVKADTSFIRVSSPASKPKHKDLRFHEFQPTTKTRPHIRCPIWQILTHVPRYQTTEHQHRAPDRVGSKTYPGSAISFPSWVSAETSRRPTRPAMASRDSWLGGS